MRRPKPFGIIAVLLACAATWFGTRWYYRAQARITWMESQAEIVANRVRAEDARVDAAIAQAKADSMALAHDSIAEALNAAPAPLRPPDPVSEPETVEGAAELLEEWVAYADTMTARYGREQDLRLRREREIVALNVTNDDLRRAAQLDSLTIASQEVTIVAQALEIATLRKPPPWYKSDIAVGLYGAAGGVLLEEAAKRIFRSEPPRMEFAATITIPW